MSHNSSPAWRVWWLRPWNSNPLMRASDRWEALFRLLAVAVMLLAVPVAAAIGTATYSSSAERISVENAAKTEVPATVLTEPKQTVAAGPAQAAHFEAQIQWKRDGDFGKGTIEVRRDTKVGSTVQTWLGPDGLPGDQPQKPASAVTNGIGTCVALLVGVGFTLLALLWCVTRVLERLHAVRWESELRGLGRPIGT
ncbi:Rv1733c family protein [Nocardia tengchongensis]|uniref:Rv1733c family protein n=1 Tax=Nocardia tengchongensis TaxID=2055889 RepID=UPI0036CA8C75